MPRGRWLQQRGVWHFPQSIAAIVAAGTTANTSVSARNSEGCSRQLKYQGQVDTMEMKRISTFSSVAQPALGWKACFSICGLLSLLERRRSARPRFERRLAALVSWPLEKQARLEGSLGFARSR